MRRAGFPQRIPIPAFMAKYKGLAVDFTAPTPRTKDEVIGMLRRLEGRHARIQEEQRMKPDHDADEGITVRNSVASDGTFTGWVVGKSKIFLKHWHTEILNTMNGANQRAAVMIQSYVRMHQQRTRYVFHPALTRCLPCVCVCMCALFALSLPLSV
jgi:hypothetical protein